MKFTVFCVIITAIVGSTLSAPDIKGRIIGGHQIDIEDACFTVYVQVKWSPLCSVVCDGSIISTSWVLTAGHCVTKPTGGAVACVLPNSLSALIGLLGQSVVAPNTLKITSDSNTPASGGGNSHTVSQVERHPNFNLPTIDYDVALLKVVDLFSSSCVVALPTAESTFPDNTPVVIDGWGLTANGGSLATYLQEATVNKVSQQNCQSAYGSGVTITDRMFCAKGNNTDACQGDSGGPATVYNSTGTRVLMGSVSFGSSTGCATPNYPGVYAYIANVDIRSFIQNIAKV